MTTEKSPHRLSIEAVGYYYMEDHHRGPAPAVIGLHGYGQRGDEFLEVLSGVAGDSLVAVAPQGFNQIRSLRTGEISFSWMTSFEKQDSIARNNQFLFSLCNRLNAERITNAPKAVFLGFSQGSSVAYRFAQAYPEKVAGIVSVCADLPPDVEENLEPLQEIPILVAYSPEDRIVGEEHPLHAISVLESSGLMVESFVFEGGHRVPSSLGPKLHEWMNKHIS